MEFVCRQGVQRQVLILIEPLEVLPSHVPGFAYPVVQVDAIRKPRR